MVDAVVKFEREDREGLIAVGSYLIDVIERHGIRRLDKCDRQAKVHKCTVLVKSGGDILSPVSAAETEHFSSSGRKPNERLACEAKIISAGEIVIMTEEKKQEPTEKKRDSRSKIVVEFESLPLEKKIADLVRMEAVTLGETISFVLNSPYMVFEKIGDVLADFGMKIEQEAKKASRPTEGEAKSKESTAKAKPASPKRPSSARTARPAKE